MTTNRVDSILGDYSSSNNAGVLTNLYRLLMHGTLAGTGRLVILPVDQGFEHGPARSFAPNPEGYDPLYHFQLAVDAGLNALAAPLGLLELGATQYAGQIPLILKCNSGTSHSTTTDQAVYGSVRGALRLGCVGIGFTIYPGSEFQYAQMEELAALAREAKEAGLLVVVWSYPRGGKLTKPDETALDVIAYAAHKAALLGTHIIKVKPPSNRIALNAAKAAYSHKGKPEDPFDVDWDLPTRIEHIVKSAFDGQRIVIFSGGEAKEDEAILKEIADIAAGGGFGSIVGRNSFQRPHDKAVELLGKIQWIYKKASRPSA